MDKKTTDRKTGRKLLSLLLCVVMIAAMLPLAAQAAINYGDLTVEQPVLAVSGTGLPGGARSSVANVSNEKSYTMAELKAMSITDTQYYSSAGNTTFPTEHRIYISQGAELEGILSRSNATIASTTSLTVGFWNRSGGVISGSGTATYSASSRVLLFSERNYFPGIYPHLSTSDEGTIVKPMLAWLSTNTVINATNPSPPLPTLPPSELEYPRLVFGQANIGETVHGWYPGDVHTIHVGGAIAGTDITVLEETYTRAQMLIMPRAERTYESTRVRGVPLAYLLDDLNDDAIIEFASVDNWSGMQEYTMTKAELVAKNAILAYEVRNSANTGWDGYIRTQTTPNGLFRLWVDGLDGAHAVNSVTSLDPGKPLIRINSHPAPTTPVVSGNISGSLSVSASVTLGATLTYQWYQNTTNNTTTGTLISGATGASLAIPTGLAVGDNYYFYCIVSAVDAISRTSNSARVTVSSPIAPPTPGEDYIGDAFPGSGSTALLRITGEVEKEGYFTRNGLLSYQDYVQTKTYAHLNSFGTSGSQTVTGIYLEDLLKEIMTLNTSARSITLHSADTASARFPLSSTVAMGAYTRDLQGNQMMLFFDGASNLRLAVGQYTAGQANRGLWLQNVTRIEVSSIAVDDPGLQRPPRPDGEIDEEEEEGLVPELPTVSVEAEAATPEQVAVAEEAVAEAVAHGAENSITILPTGDPVVVSSGSTKPTKTNVTGIEATGATVMAIVNEDGTLTPVPTKIEEDGSVTVLITGDVLLVPLHVEADFNDLAGHWGEDEINKAASLMIVEGIGGGLFDPKSEVTGAEAVTMFLRAIGFPIDHDAPEVEGVNQDRWYAGAVNTAAEAGLATNLDPEKPMTRLETAKLIYSALEVLGIKPVITLEKAKEATAAFTDLGHLTDEETMYMGLLIELGIFKGRGDGTMGPEGILHRDQMASLAVRFQALIFG